MLEHRGSPNSPIEHTLWTQKGTIPLKVYNPDGNGAKPSFKDLVEKDFGSNLDAAKTCNGMGLAVNPCEGKKPILNGWTKTKLTDDKLPEHFPEGRNLGIVLGELSGGLVNVDIDVLEALKVSDHFFPDTLCGGREGTPGTHRYYWAPGAKNKKWLDANGHVLAEILSTGSQTLFPPSINPETGESYRFVKEGILEPVEISPAELYQRCGELATAAAIARRMPPEGRHYLALALAGHLLRRLDGEAVLNILIGAWEAADALKEGVEAELEGLVRDTANKLQSGEPVTGGPTLAEADPDLLKVLDRFWGRTNGKQARASAGDNIEERVPTHDELGDRWTEGNPGHKYGQGEWKQYERGIFNPVPKDTVKRRILKTLEEAKSEGVRPTAGLLASVSELARVKLAIPDEEWDADPDILVCGNGTLHIPTGELRPHSPEYHATSAVSYDYDENAVAPTWELFLRDFVDAETASFLQEFAGYALTIDVSHEIALWLCGPPGGGRSTLIVGFEAMLGEKVGTLGLGEIERSRFALGDVPSKTLLTATEQPAGYMKASYVLNALISGDKLKVEKKFKDAFDVYSKAKILWAMNDVPRIPSANDGLFRRVKVIKIEPIPEDKRNVEIKEAIKGEGAGILNWALEGLRRLRKRGHFEIPESVREATEEFRQTNDVPGMFVEEVCIVSDHEDCKEQSEKLYKAYVRWCRESGHKPLATSKVAKEWERLGFKKKILHGRAFWRGVRVDEGWLSNQENYPRS